ncbi:MAG TPA: DMT family transporter [Actinomycetota bacterium]|nr:DMT family transporter [Actinomycetota bacterium]
MQDKQTHVAPETIEERHASGFHVGGVIAVSFGVFLWAASTVIVKDSEVSGTTFAVCRLWVGFPALWLLTRLTGRRVTKEVWRAALIPGVLFAANIALFFEALQRSTVANVTLITSIQPALVFLVARRMFRERITQWDWGWTAASMGGIALVVVGAASRPGWHPTGDLLALCAILIWTVFFLASKRIRANTGTLEYFTAVLGIAAVALTPAMLIGGGWFGDPSARDWLLIVIVAIGPGTAGHLLVTWAHRHVDVSLNAMIGVGQPVMAAAGAALFLGEELVPLQVVGGIITIVSVIAVVRRRRLPVADVVPEGAP